MNWLIKVLESEFLWGTVLGIILSILTARATLYFQARTQEKMVRLFTADLIANIKDYVMALEESRDRSRVIFVDILALVEVEIGIWGRNREHLILFRDHSERKDLRDFFAKSARLVVEIKDFVQRFNDRHREALDQPNGSQAQQEALNDLAAAHQKCDKLVAHIRAAPEIKLKS